MILDYSYSTLQQFPLYQGLGDVWTFNGAALDEPVILPSDGVGIEFRVKGRLHFSVDPGRLHFKPVGRLHFGPDDEDV